MTSKFQRFTAGAPAYITVIPTHTGHHIQVVGGCEETTHSMSTREPVRRHHTMAVAMTCFVAQNSQQCGQFGIITVLFRRCSTAMIHGQRTPLSSR
ncbi:hypothetical protein BDW02DRAFT_568325 [Decorospora gaudefroyi]|uniref:Uncharacterized protein n=1 Tax=Decorospora gaudefroyi TaxID=184978 RepID=A0A6A5KNN1_9PLEO|nr:hypothetical protein BDW02DRAFT_568325 [Decorospora gaudefroyi]